MADNSPCMEDKSELLYRSIVEGSADVVSTLLAGGASPDFDSFYGNWPLLTCLRHNRLEIAKLLINAGARLSAKDHDGRTILFHALQGMNEEFFELILNQGGEVNVSDHKGLTLLHLAAENKKYIDFMKVLLKHKANIDAKCREGKTPLHFAIQSGSPLFILLLKYNPNPEMIEYQDLLYDLAVANSFDEVTPYCIDILLKYGFTVGKKYVRDGDFLLAAIKSGFHNLVEHLLHLGADPNYTVREGLVTPLQIACEKNQLNSVKLLLKYRAKVNETFFWIVAEDNNPDIFKLLMEGKVVDDDNSLPEQDKPWFNVNSSFSGKTLAHIAAREGSPEFIKILSEYGADFEIRNKDGKTPLEVAFHEKNIFRNCDEAVCELLRLGANVNAVDVSNITEGRDGFAEFFMGGRPNNPRQGKHWSAIRENIAALHCAGFYVRDECLSLLQHEEAEGIESKYNTEIESMKNTFLCKSHVSYFDLLKSNTHEIMNLLRNSEIADELKSEAYKKEFPNYSNFLWRNIEIGFKRSGLIRDVKMHLIPTVEAFNSFPQEVVNIILSFLSLEDLAIMSGHFRPRQDVSVPGIRIDPDDYEDPAADYLEYEEQVKQKRVLLEEIVELMEYSP